MDDDAFITQHEAESSAEDELLATPALVAAWLADRCQEHQTPQPVTFGHDVSELDVPALVAALLGGTASQCVHAADALRDVFRLDMREAIEQRARSIFDHVNGLRR